MYECSIRAFPTEHKTSNPCCSVLAVVDIDSCKVGIEEIPWYAIDDDGIPIREPKKWNWEQDLRDPDICSPEFGERLISGISTGLALEILENLEELGIAYMPPEEIPFPEI